MKRFVAQTWNNIAEPDIYLHEEGYYVVKFQSISDLQTILYGGPYSINSRPIVLKQWSPDYDFNNEFLTEIPLWVKFPKLPMNCWGCNSLRRMASTLGKPLFADECTTKQTRISYARILIEVNVTKRLPTEVTVIDPTGRKFQQGVVYEWKPEFCGEFNKLGMTVIKLSMKRGQHKKRDSNSLEEEECQKEQFPPGK